MQNPISQDWLWVSIPLRSCSDTGNEKVADVFFHISLENFPCCIHILPRWPASTMHICIQVYIHLKITPEEGKKLPLEGNMIFYNLKKKKYSMQTFDKMRYLVHEVFFHIQDYVRAWYVFKVVWKQRCLAPARKDKTRPLLLLLSVTVKTFKIQNQGQHCAPLSYERVTTVGWFFAF